MSVKVCGYGVKVSADDPNLDVKALALNIGKVNRSFAEHIHPFFTDPDFDGRGAGFDHLAFSFKQLVDEELMLFEFVFLDGPAFGSFAIVTRASSSEVHDGDTSEPPMDQHRWTELKMMQIWTRDFLPGYKAGWIAEDIDPDFVGKWRQPDDSKYMDEDD